MVSFFAATRINTGLSRVLVQPGGSVGKINDRQPTNFAFIDGIYGPVRTAPFAGAFHLYGWGYRVEQPNIRDITIDANSFRPALMRLLLTQKPAGRVRTAIGTTLDYTEIEVYSSVVIAAISPINEGRYWFTGDQSKQRVVVTFACRSSYSYSEVNSE